MALRAVGAHLAAMNVRVAVGAIFADVGENRLHVALSAGHFFVHAAQRVFGFVVIKFGNSADGPPASGGVAILAGNGERAMGIASGLILRSGNRLTGKGSGVRRRQAGGGDGKQCPESELEQRERRVLPNPRQAQTVVGKVLKNHMLLSG